MYSQEKLSCLAQSLVSALVMVFWLAPALADSGSRRDVAMIQETDPEIEKGEYDKAIEACKKAIAIEPFSWRAHDQLGCAYRKSGHLIEAIQAYDRGIVAAADREDGVSIAGSENLYARDQLEAINKDLVDASKADKTVCLLAARGRIMLLLEEPAKAAADADEAVTHDPKGNNILDALPTKVMRVYSNRCQRKASQVIRQVLLGAHPHPTMRCNIGNQTVHRGRQSFSLANVRSTHWRVANRPHGR